MADPPGRENRPRTLPQRRGDTAEQVVADSLARDGWAILGRNVHAGRSELDIVAVDPGPPPRLVVGEVRWRASRDFGLPEETFDWRKRRRLREGLGRLLEVGRLPDGTPLPDLSVGIDLFAVEPASGEGTVPRIRHHRDVGSG
jgi:putative endonuclease